MLFKTISASVYGIDAYPVEVEVDVGSAYMNDFNVVGLPDNAVKESRERIKSALHKLWIRISPRAGSDHQPGACGFAQGRLRLRPAYGHGCGGLPGAIFWKNARSDDVPGRTLARWQRTPGARRSFCHHCGARKR